MVDEPAASCDRRLTNASSKKLENLTAAGSRHFMYYDCARPHTALTKATASRPHLRWRRARPITSSH